MSNGFQEILFSVKIVKAFRLLNGGGGGSSGSGGGGGGSGKKERAIALADKAELAVERAVGG